MPDDDATKKEGQDLKVLKQQADKLEALDTCIDRLDEQSNAAIHRAERTLAELGREPMTPVPGPRPLRPSPGLRPWSELVAEAEMMIDEPVLIDDLLTPAEMAQVNRQLGRHAAEFEAIHRLDKLDWAICGVAGILAALVDIVLIQMPQHPGFLGGEPVAGGPLANWLKARINQSLTPAEVRQLEQANWVPYDAAHSSHLSEPVAGLSPSTHRFHSLGHDPLLGFIFGVKDILLGTFTAIDKNGQWVVQEVPLKDPALVGMNLFEAIGRVYGHLKSDVTSPRGLPAPLMPLLQLLQVGHIGQQGYTIGEVARIMYRSGYDFRHFTAMTSAPLLIEVLVRLSYLAKRLHEGYSLTEALPVSGPGHRHPKLPTMLFAAHLLATAANAGKVALGQNPLLINYPQWLAFFRYALPQLKWVLLDRENEKLAYIQAQIDETWQTLDQNLAETWRLAGGELVTLR